MTHGLAGWMGMQRSRPMLDLDERKPKRRFADLFGGANNNDLGQAPANGQYADSSSAPPPGMSNYAGRGGTTGAQVNVPLVNPNAYQYGGAAGGAASFNNQLQNESNTVQDQAAAQIQNQYDTRDQGNVQGTLGGLAQFYGNQLNGTGPSLAAAQMQQATDQNIAAQQAGANSAKGGLASALAQRNAGNTAAGMEQNAAQQSMQGRIQEEYNAAQGMSGLGNLYEQEQGLNIGQAEQQAQLQEEQQKVAAATGLGYAGLEGQTNAEQLQAQMAQQQQMSNNYLAASGMGMNQSQFNTTQDWNEVAGAVSAAGGLLAAADADFQEPSPEIGRKGGFARHYGDGDMQPPAHLTLREERSLDDRPFMLLADQNTHQLEKVATKKLTPAERREALGPHGAGPIFAQGATRTRTTMHDLGMQEPGALAAPPGLASLAGGMVGNVGGANAGAQVSGAAMPMPTRSGPNLAHMLGGALQGFASGSHGQLASLPQVMQQERQRQQQQRAPGLAGWLGGQPTNAAPPPADVPPAYSDADLEGYGLARHMGRVASRGR